MPATEHAHFVICIRNEGCEDLELRKLYQVLPDSPAESSGFLRIIDESGEDYLYPQDHFLILNLPSAIEDVLASISASS